MDRDDALKTHPLYMAAIACPHSIEANKITLHRDPNKPGNALNQLGKRLDAALLAQGAAPSQDGEAAKVGALMEMSLATIQSHEATIAELRAQLSTARADGIALAANWIDKRREDFIAEHGFQDPETGTIEYGRGAHAEAKHEYETELVLIAEGLLALQCLERPAAQQPSKELLVTSILLDVVPGDDGEGVEVYAKSVDDVVTRLTSLSNEIEELKAQQPSETAIHNAAIKAAANVCDAKFEAREKSGHPREASTARALASEIRSLLRPAAQEAEKPSAPTDISKRLRQYGVSGDVSDGALLIQAADEIERYYGGMLAWKATAEAKDREAAREQPAAPSEDKPVEAGCLTKTEIHTMRRLIECAEELDKRPRPMCRDCADEDGTCPNSGLECDMSKLFSDAKALHNKFVRHIAEPAAQSDSKPARRLSMSMFASKDAALAQQAGKDGA